MRICTDLDTQRGLKKEWEGKKKSVRERLQKPVNQQVGESERNVGVRSQPLTHVFEHMLINQSCRLDLRSL